MTPAAVRADPEALRRLLANLVDNAAKYSPEGSPVRVTVAASGDQVELAVADQGPGIPASERERVFTRFYRGDPARARATGGSGLGLAIVAAVARDHGGSARAEEAPGGGTLVVVTLPLAGPSPARIRSDVGRQVDAALTDASGSPAAPAMPGRCSPHPRPTDPTTPSPRC